MEVKFAAIGKAHLLDQIIEDNDTVGFLWGSIAEAKSLEASTKRKNIMCAAAWRSVQQNGQQRSHQYHLL